MQTNVESALSRWTEAQLISPELAGQLRAYEAEQAPATGTRWQVIALLAAGGTTIAAGVLLFVAAHWESLSPSWRFLLVLSLVAVFHVAGAVVAEKFHALSVALHAIGTASLGAGIFLAGQIFNLNEHWPGGVMLWALGAVIGYLLLRDAAQAVLAALLVPAWLMSEWFDAVSWYRDDFRAPAVGALCLAFAYLTMLRKQGNMASRAVSVAGAIAVLPAAIAVVTAAETRRYYNNPADLPGALLWIGWTLAILLPMAFAAYTRRKQAWVNLAGVALAVSLAFSRASHGATDASLAAYAWDRLGAYLICTVGSFGLVFWGIGERRSSGINLGLIGFAITVMTFYFSEVMDKLGRSAALIGFGLILLIVAWGLEKTRKRLIARIAAGGAR